MPSPINKFGPSILLVAAILGPGTILANAKVGAFFGYSAAWVLVLAAILLGGMVSLAAHIGLVYEKSPFAEIADRLGRTTAAVLAILLFVAIARLLMENNLAIAVAVQPLLGHGASVAAILTVNLLALLAIYLLPDPSRRAQIAVGGLVVAMGIAFVAVAIATRPSVLATLKGMIPVLPKPGYELLDPYLILQGLIATTFSVTAAVYAGYLVRQRGWTLEDSEQAQGDANFGILLLTGISMLIMMVSATVFYGKPTPPSLAIATDLALPLGPLIGTWANTLFTLGILVAAIASLLVNAMIGGTILSDGFGGGAKIGDRWPRHATALALAFGLLGSVTGLSHSPLVHLAQSLAVPALAFALIYLATRPELTGRRKLRRNTLSLAYLGGAVALILAFRTGTTLITGLFFGS
jgi:manganese transport protein